MVWCRTCYYGMVCITSMVWYVSMELGFSEQFTNYEMELETHGHVQIGNQLEFHEHQFACTN